ncbi:MAG TPA: maleylacetoacetate isomerase [Burkholderiales bacterium]|nr:maleylacetoacetate isomerase [Burkholderiales bacterium]
MKLYTYFRSSAAFRLRIVLNLKGLDHELVPISLLNSEQLTESYKAMNPQGLVPMLEDEGQHLTQSLAICEYLEETHPEPALLPKPPIERARVRAIALVIACEIHPLNNLRVLKHLKNALQQDEDARNAWYRHWIAEGLGQVETLLSTNPWTGRFCHGDSPGLADAFLIPQVANAVRYQCPLDAYPTIRRINDECLALPAFAKAQPHLQPDAI